MKAPNPLAQKLVENVTTALSTYALPPEDRGMVCCNLISYARRSYINAHSQPDQEILDFMVDFDSRISSQVPYTFLRRAAQGAFTVNEDAINLSFVR